MEPRFDERAVELILGGRNADARALLEAGIQQMPPGWTPSQEDDEFLHVSFWDEEEFFAHCERESQPMAKSILWAVPSYSRAWHSLAAIAVNEEQFEQALFCLDCGLALEPDHPELWNERGYTLGKLERHEDAFDCYRKAASVRGWALPSQIARALRGQGIQLIDLARLDEAEGALRRSLGLEPDDEVAHHELRYIEDLRREREARNEALPWFIDSLVNPPVDPLTIRLLALVEGLPPIDGPQTVGPENYSRIFDAFMEHGWAGFEEEFDRIVSRERTDYADVKRDLLREPIFSIKGHRHMAGALLGVKTAEEVFDEILRERDKVKKPL